MRRLPRNDPPFQSGHGGVFEYAQLLSIPVVQTEMNCDGILSTMGRRFVIQVRRSSPIMRKSFTVCHEIGHAEILRSADIWSIEQKFYTMDLLGRNREEEELSNLFAAELLMPRRVFTALAKNLSPGLDSLRKLAGSFATSLCATAFRITKLNLWQCIMVWSVPQVYVGGRLGLHILRSARPQDLDNPFRWPDYEGQVIIDHDKIHRALTQEGYTDFEIRLRDQQDQVSLWRLESVPSSVRDKPCVLTVMTQKRGTDFPSTPFSQKMRSGPLHI